MTKFICLKNEKEVAIRAAEIMSEVIKKRPDALLGLATGSTPVGMYRELVKRHLSGELSFSRVRSVNLDEYVGLEPCHSQSYAAFMAKNLFDSIDIKSENTFIPNGAAEDPEAECKRYDLLLDSLGRVDIQLLGIGHNGHVAFNEPDSFFTKDTTHVRLTDSTVKANSRFFDSEDQVPKEAISMGIGRILRSKKILLLVTGQGKADILEKALFGRVTPEVPASILQFYQGELTVVGDEAAFRTIREKHAEIVN